MAAIEKANQLIQCATRSVRRGELTRCAKLALMPLAPNLAAVNRDATESDGMCRIFHVQVAAELDSQANMPQGGAGSAACRTRDLVQAPLACWYAFRSDIITTVPIARQPALLGADGRPLKKLARRRARQVPKALSASVAPRSRHEAGRQRAPTLNAWCAGRPLGIGGILGDRPARGTGRDRRPRHRSNADPVSTHLKGNKPISEFVEIESGHRLSGGPIDPIHTPFGGNVLFLNIA